MVIKEKQTYLMFRDVWVNNGVLKTLVPSHKTLLSLLTGDGKFSFVKRGNKLSWLGVSTSSWQDEMFPLKSDSMIETLPSKDGRMQVLSLPSSQVDVLTCVKRSRRFLPDIARSWPMFKLLVAPPEATSRESNDSLSQCSDLLLKEASAFVVIGDPVLSFLTTVGLDVRSLWHRILPLLFSLGVSHQFTTDAASLVYLPNTLTDSLLCSLGVTWSLRFSLGVSMSSNGDNEPERSTPVMLAGLWNQPKSPLSEQSSL